VVRKRDGGSRRVDAITASRRCCERRALDKRAVLEEISADTSPCLGVQRSHCVGGGLLSLVPFKVGEGKQAMGMTPSRLR